MIRQHHRINTAVALSAIVAGLIVAGCGTSSSSGKAAGAQTVRAAYVSPSGAGYQLAMKVTGNAGGRTIDVTGTGAIDVAAHAGQLTLNINRPTADGERLQISAVILGTDYYLKLPPSLAGNIPGGKPWVSLNLSEIGKTVGMQGLSSLANSPGDSPAQLLKMMRSASTDGVQNLGQQTIDGISTTASRATIDLSKAADTLPASEQASASSAIAAIERITGLRYLPIEAWIDSSDRVRQIVLSETGHVEGQPFSEQVQLDFVKYGLEPMPATPPAGEVTNIMSLAGSN
jgi:hypothetical protein